MKPQIGLSNPERPRAVWGDAQIKETFLHFRVKFAYYDTSDHIILLFNSDLIAKIRPKIGIFSRGARIVELAKCRIMSNRWKNSLNSKAEFR